MKINTLNVCFIVLYSLLLFSCTSIHKSMREPDIRLNLEKSDFTLSDQLIAEATSTRIILIDWARIFTKKTGSIGGSASNISVAMIPVIGGYVFDQTSNYALYELMQDNPGYDVVFYPQYETKIVRPFLGIGFIYRVTKVKVTARLGRLNKINLH